MNKTVLALLITLAPSLQAMEATKITVKPDPIFVEEQSRIEKTKKKLNDVFLLIDEMERVISSSSGSRSCLAINNHDHLRTATGNLLSNITHEEPLLRLEKRSYLQPLEDRLNQFTHARQSCPNILLSLTKNDSSPIIQTDFSEFTQKPFNFGTHEDISLDTVEELTNRMHAAVFMTPKTYLESVDDLIKYSENYGYLSLNKWDKPTRQAKWERINPKDHPLFDDSLLSEEQKSERDAACDKLHKEKLSWDVKDCRRFAAYIRNISSSTEGRWYNEDPIFTRINNKKWKNVTVTMPDKSTDSVDTSEQYKLFSLVWATKKINQLIGIAVENKAKQDQKPE